MHTTRSLLVAALLGSAAYADTSVKAGDLDPAKATAKAPDVYKAKFTTTKGDFTIEVHRDWAPFGKVSGDGMKVVDAIEGLYGEGAPGGNGPRQDRIQNEGNAYLKADFPKLDSIKSAKIVP